VCEEGREKEVGGMEWKMSDDMYLGMATGTFYPACPRVKTL
jgi:hypothetical protein